VLKPPYFPPFDALLPEPVIAGEDCLNLNIWTPAKDDVACPVLVWIHGGAFANGSGAIDIYDGTQFALDGVVCITINYRLGVDGYLFWDDGVSNLGVLDQIAALQWVHDNINIFGGDSSNVTIAGESAGAMSVTTLLSLPQTEGLFQRVIAQSGAGHHVLPAATAKRVTHYLAEKLELKEPITREVLANIPPARLIQAQIELSTDAFAHPDPLRWGEVAANLMPFEPIIDGALLERRPIDALVAGAGRGVAVLIGTNTEEERLFMVPNGAINHVSEVMVQGLVAAYGLPVTETLQTYRQLRPQATPGDLLEAIVTDWFFRIPAIRVAEARVGTGNSATYMYEFAWRSPQFNGTLGACHGLEIAFAFNTLDKANNSPLAGSNPPTTLAKTMHTAWVGFITSGNPGWPQYELDHRATMRFDEAESAVVHDLRAAERLLWEGHR
jgi:para-nitrobenzyl esterase